MRILILGDYPLVIGGVSNYTRPLHEILNSFGQEVHYLFSSGGYKKNYNYLFSPYLKTYKKTEGIFWHEIINSSNGIINFKNPIIDIESKKIERIVDKLIGRIQPDVIHINELIGLTSKIVELAKNRNIKVVITVHEYWWLCIHRVMIDYNNKICVGPNDIRKCSFCVSERYKDVKVESKLKMAFKNVNPKIFNTLLDIKKRIKTSNTSKQTGNIFSLQSESKDYKEINVYNEGLENQLANRLEANIKYLNRADVVIAVSEEVKQILSKYGVIEDKIIVQHIGSLIASKKIDVSKTVYKERFTFGFIGGVTFYKGIHVLVDAYLRLEKEAIDNSEVLIFGKYQEDYISAIKVKYGSQTAFENIKFLGKYSANDLIDIYSKIDIMVLPSICNDTAPQTIFESFAAGIPIIGPNIGGFPDFIEHDKNGLLFEAGNADDLKEKMQYILENPNLIAEYRKNIPKLKTLEENAEELITLYKSK